MNRLGWVVVRDKDSKQWVTYPVCGENISDFSIGVNKFIYSQEAAESLARGLNEDIEAPLGPEPDEEEL